MLIDQTYQTNNVYQRQSQLPAVQNAENKSANKTENGDQVSISPAGRNAEEKWQTIADMFDVANISTRERGAMASELAENNLISNPVAMAMMAPLSMNDDLDTKVNFLETSRESLAAAKSNGASSKQVELQESVVKILEQLYGLAGNSTENIVERSGTNNQA